MMNTSQRSCLHRKSVPLLWALLLFAMLGQVQAQTDSTFWFVAPEVSTNHSDRPIAFRITTESAAATIRITTPADSSIFDTTWIMPANATVSIPLTHRIALIENQPHNQILNKGFLIQSTELITAYYEVISAGNNPDIFALKGRNALGTDFFITAQNLMANVHGHERIDIVATENNTTITIQNKAALAGGIGAGSTTTIQLQRGQTYSLRTNSQNGNVSQAGTRITSNKLIAITYTDDSVRGGTEFGGGCYDLLGDQHIPVDVIGQEYIVMRGFLHPKPSTNQFAEIVLITAIENQTSIQINGGNVITTLQSGESYTYRLSDSTAFIQASKPIYVAHISGFGCETGLAILPSIACTGSRQVGFTRTSSEFFGVNIMTKSANIAGFALNGTPIPSSVFQPVPGTGGVWQFTRWIASISEVPIGSGNLLTNNLGPFHMGIINGGASSGCRYGYFSDFARYTLQGQTNSPPTNPICEGGTLELYADSLLGATYLWRNPAGMPFATTQNPSIPNFSAVDTGAYVVTAMIDGCSSDPDTVWVGMKPLPAAPNPSSTGPYCEGDDLVLLADSLPGLTYQWTGPNGFSSNLRNPILPQPPASAAGWYSLSVSLDGCSRAPDSVLVEIFDRPAISTAAVANDSLCPGTLAQFTVDSLPGATYIWTGPTGFQDSLREPTLLITQPSQTGWYMVSATVNGCSSLPDSVWLTVVPNQVSVQLLSGADTLCAQDTAWLQVDSLPGYQYQWLRNNQLLPGQTAATLGANIGGVYRVLAQSPLGCSDTSAAMVLHFRPSLPATITTNLLPAILCGQDSILLSAPSGYHYQWYRNDTLISGSINHQLWVYQAGQYRLQMSDAHACTQSSASVEIQAQPVQLPTIQIAGSTHLCPGQSSLLTTHSSNALQWLFNDSLIAGANDSFLVVTQPGAYRLIATNPAGCSDTTDATHILRQDPAGALIIPMANPQLCIGDSLTLRLHLQNVQSFVWYRNGHALSHADTLLTTSSSGQYQVIFTSNGGCIDSSNAIQLSQFSPSNVQILSSQGSTICANDSSLLRASANSATAYQWERNGIPLPSANTDSLWVNQAGNYSLLVLDSNGCTQRFGPYPIQTYEPINTQITTSGPLQICEGDSLSLAALDTPIYQYQWYRNGLILQNDTLSTLQVSQSGQYQVVITTTNQCQANSNLLQVLMHPQPTASLQPSGQTVLCQGDSLLLEGLPSLGNFSWLHNGSLLSGANSSQLWVSAAGQYQLVFQNANGCRDTSEATLVSLSSLPTVTIGLQWSQPICEGDTAVLLVNNPQPDWTYDWLFNGTVLGQHGTQLTTSTAGLYELVVTDSNGCRGHSNVINLAFAPLPQVILLNDTLVQICEFSQTRLEVQAISNHRYQWYRNNTAIPAADQSFYDAYEAGSYRCEVSSPQGCSQWSSEIQIDLVPLPPSITPATNGQYCEGEDLQLLAPQYPGNYHWWGPAGFQSAAQNPMIYNLRLSNSGWYYLQIETNGCLGPVDSIWVSVEPKLPPIHIEGRTEICAGNPIHLTTEALANAHYRWTLPNGDTLAGTELFIEKSWLTDAGTYKLEISNGSCSSEEIEVQLTVENYQFFFPTAFTPNGDGLNDEFYPVTTFTGAYELQVFDRWGKLVFQTTDPQARWNGEINGTLGAQSAYAYVLFYDGCTGAREALQGSVFLLR